MAYRPCDDSSPGVPLVKALQSLPRLPRCKSLFLINRSLPCISQALTLEQKQVRGRQVGLLAQLLPGLEQWA